MNGILAQICDGIGNQSNNKRGCEETNKSNSILYHYFICNFVEHKIYYYLHKDVTQAMFREKAMITTPKKEDVVVNMVLVITTRSQIPENVVFKEKKPFKNKSLADWQEEKKFQCSFEGAIKDIQQKEPLKDLYGANIQTLVKTNFTRNFNPYILINQSVLLVLLVLPNLLMLPVLPYLLNPLEILELL